MMKSIKKPFTFFSLITLVLVSQGVSAEDQQRLGIGGRIQFTTWKGDNNGNSPDFESDATMAAVNIRYQRGRFYTGASIQGGNFSFNDGAPDQHKEDKSTTTDSSVTINRGELDLIAGYYFWSQVSLFLDIKAVGNQWKDKDYQADYVGVGMGITAFAPLPNNWTFYASFGFVPLKIETSGNNIGDGGGSIGDGDGSSLELGSSYTIDTHHSVSIGIKAQTQEYNFNNGKKQTHHLGGLVVGYNYNFF